MNSKPIIQQSSSKLSATFRGIVGAPRNRAKSILAGLLFAIVSAHATATTMLPVTGVTATDGTSTSITISYTAPVQPCSGTNYMLNYQLMVDGVAKPGYINSTVQAWSGASSFMVNSGLPGTHSFSVTSKCVDITPGYAIPTAVLDSLSAADTGYAIPVNPLPVTAVGATQGLFPTYIIVTFDAPNQTNTCSAISYVVTRDGVDIGSVAPPYQTADTFALLDTTATAGTHTYGVRSSCANPVLSVTSGITNIGFMSGVPLSALSVQASDGYFQGATQVVFQTPVQPAACTTVTYGVMRDGILIGNVPPAQIDFNGGYFDDASGVPGVSYSYSVMATCNPGSGQTTSAADTGFTATSGLLPATSVVASDGTFPDRVRISYTAPAQTCPAGATLYYVLNVDGAPMDITSAIPFTGGSSFFDFMTTSATPRSFQVRASCTATITKTHFILSWFTGYTSLTWLDSLSVADTGYANPLTSIPAAATTVSASDGTYSNQVLVSFTAPDQTLNCSSATYTVTRDGADIGASVVALTGGPGTYSDTLASPGIHSYAVRATCTPGAATATSVADTGYILGTPAAPTAITASDGAYSNQVLVSFTAANQTLNCSSTTYTVTRDGLDVGTSVVALIGGPGTYSDTLASPGIHSYAVRATCTPGAATATSVADTGYINGTPNVVSSVAATDGLFPNKVTVTFTAPSQVAVCTAISYVVVRDGVDQTTLSAIPLIGGAGSYDDLTMTAGVHTYSIRSVCAPGTGTTNSLSDTGYILGTPAAPTAITASDGAYSNQVLVSFTSADQTLNCSSVTYTVTRDGADIGTSVVALTGGPGTYSDTLASPGIHSYAVRATCTPGAATATSVADTGYINGTPNVVSSVAATDGLFPNKVTVTFTAPSQVAVCTAISYVVVRDGVDQTTLSAIPLIGGAGIYDDLTMTAGVHTYSIRSVCTPGTGTTNSLSDTGYFLGTPAPATAVSATDGTYSNQVVISLTAPVQSSSCSSVDYMIVRDGVDLGYIAGAAAGPYTWNDTLAPSGIHSYLVRSICYPGLATAVSAIDTGYKSVAPNLATAVVASDGIFPNKVAVTFTAPDQSLLCSSISYAVTRDGLDVSLVTTIPLTGGPGAVDDNTASAGVHVYGVRSICSPGTGTSNSLTDTGYIAGIPAPVTALVASDGLYTNYVGISFTAPDQTASCSSVAYEIVRDGVDLYALLTVPLVGGAGAYNDTTATPGIHSYTVRSICTPGASTSVSLADTGYINGTPNVASAVVATDGLFPNKVTVTFTAPDQSAVCTSASYVIVRDGVDLTTITTIPLIGGAGTFDDTTLAIGTHTYGVRSVCSPGTGTSNSLTDTGYKLVNPAPVTAVAASDGTFANEIQVTFTAPDQTANCTAVYYVVVRDLVDLATVVTVPLVGGTGTYDDLTVGVGIHSYAVRSWCLLGNATATSLADTGYRSIAPASATAVAATDGTFPNKVTVSFTAPDQSLLCTASSYVVVRDGVDLATLTTIPLIGGPGTYDDTTMSVGTHVYGIRSLCSPGTGTTNSLTDTGYFLGTPAAPTVVAATDGLFSTKVQVTFTAPNQSASCTSVSYVVIRDLVDQPAITTIPLTGGAGSYDDTTATMGVHSYTVKAVCSPGNAIANSLADTGFLQPGAPAPTVIAATDYTLLDRVTISVTVPAAPFCTTRSVILARDGVDIGTITTIPLAGGTATYDDMLPTLGVHSYSARSHCDYVTGNNDSASISDNGSMRYPAVSCTSVDTASATIGYSPTGSMIATARGVQNASLVRIRAAGQPNGLLDTTFYSTTQTVADYAGTILLANHSPGVPEYGIFNVDAMATGLNPGDTEAVCASTTFVVYQGCSPVTVTGPQGTGPLPATITWNAAAGATGFALFESSALAGPFTQISTLPAATTTASIPGWPKMYYQVQCVASNVTGNSISPAVQVWGNPAPVVTGQTFNAGNPGATTITPVVTDPDGNTTFTLAVVTQPVNGSVTISGATFSYTPNTGFTGLDPFTISATDPQSAVGQAQFIANVTLTPPASPTNVMATDGTRATDVMVTWNQVAGTATAFDVYLGTSRIDPSPVLLGSVTEPTHVFYDLLAPQGVIRYYSVVARNGAVAGVASTVDTGFKDTPPTNLSAAGTTQYNTVLDMTPTYTDPDVGDIPTLAVLTQPVNGTAAVMGSKIRYTPSGTYVGINTFTISATDRAGQVVTGTATVTVGCLPLTTTPLILSPTRTFANGAYQASLSYSSSGCPVTYTAEFSLLSGTTVLDTQLFSGLASGQSLPLSVIKVAPLLTGTYTAQYVITNNLTLEKVTKTAPLPVEVLRLPPFTWSSTTVIASAEVAKLSMPAMSQCLATNDPVVAQANPLYCLVELLSGPPGVVPDVPTTTTGALTWSGVPTTAGSYAAVAQFSRFDVATGKSILGTVNVPLTVVAPTAVVFNLPSALTVKQSISLYNLNPTQLTGPSCPLSVDLAAAQAKVIAGSRACLLTWSSTSTDFISDGTMAKGVIYGVSPVTNTWTLNLATPSGLVALSTGATVVTPLPVTLAFNLTASPIGITAGVTPAIVSIASTGVDRCFALTSSLSLASTSSSRPCLVEFGAVSGMATNTFSTIPTLQGKLPNTPATTIPYTVSIYFNGAKTLLFTGSQDIVTTPATTPVIAVQYARPISTDVYAVSSLGGAMGVVSSDTSRGQLDGTTFVQGGTSPTAFSLTAAKTRQVVMVDPAPLYSSRTIDIALAYNLLPTVGASKTITVVSVPRDGLRLNLNNPSPTAADTAPYPISATIQELAGAAGYQYVAANAGQWMVTFGEIAMNGAFTPLTTPVATDATGTASSSINVSGKPVLRLVARADPISGATGYATPLMSRTFVVAVVKGTPIAGTVQPMTPTSGPAPYLSILRVAFDTRADQLANKSVTWFESTNGGATWTTPATAFGVQYAARYGVGTYQVKVQFENINTLQTSFSPVLTVQAYPVPKIAITGPSYLLPGDTGTLTAAATDLAGAAMPSAIWSWEIQKVTMGQAPVSVATGASSTIVFTPIDSGIYRLIVQARDATTVATDVRAWATTLRQIIVGVPGKPAVRILGPVRLETGVAGTYTATVSTPFDLTTSNLTVAGQWTLPNGSIVAGPTLTWTPTAADLALSKNAVITYSAWIVGYTAATTSTGAISVGLWSYTWPTWSMSKVVGLTVAPANSQFLVLPNDVTLLPVLEGLTYQWTIPAGMTAVGAPTSKLTVLGNFAGTYNVQAQVSDSRGNVQVLTDSITLTNPPAMVLDATATNMSKWSHSPITLGVMTKVTGGHPLDVVASYKYFVDGVDQALPSGPAARINLPNAGTFAVLAQATTRMGAVATKTVTVVVPSNQAPTCNITGTVAANRRSVALNSNCVDPDGIITKYEWFLNGTALPLFVGGVWTMILPVAVSLPVTVDLTVTDDGGLTSTSTATFN